MFKRSGIYAGVVAALGSALTLTSPHVFGQAERVEITGSAIKRTSAEGPMPVEIIKRKDIERTGATSVNELLRYIPAIDVFDQGELASNSPSGSGTANIRLRGLSENDTLVLLNGRRLPVNALYDSSGAGAAFDINSLPISAIERIEILKDGGSAIYGADAVAGVVNFITRSDYQGVTGTAYYGSSSEGDGTEKRVNLTGGFGDLSKDGYNFMVSVDYFKRDPIYRKDREISRSVDFRRLGAGDGRSSFSPSGNVIDPVTGDLVGVSYRDCPAAEQNPPGICRYDFNADLLTAYNGADRLSALAVGTVAITPDIKGFAELTFSTSKDTFKAHPVPDYFIMPINGRAELRPYEIFSYDDNGDPIAGTGTDSVYIAGRFMQGGPRTTERKSDFLNVALGAEGSTGGLDWKVALNHGVSKVTNSDSNYFNANLWIPATSSGALDPTVLTNDQAFVNGLKANPIRKGESTLTSLTGQVSGDLMKMPAGQLRYAVGGQISRESLTDTPDELTQQGLVIGSIQQAAVDAARNFGAVFGELQVPILKTVEGQLALRYDKYSDYSATSPKIGLKYTPLDSLSFRGSYTRSFRAPVLKQLFGAQEEGAATITDPTECEALGVALAADGTCLVNAFQVNGSNPNLKPEKGKTLNLGVIFDLDRTFTASVDWWQIKKTNQIDSPTLGQAIRDGLWEKDGPRYRVFTNLQNIVEAEVAGVDVDARLRFPRTIVGDLSFRNAFTYYSKNRKKNDEGGWDDFLGTYATPLFKNIFTAGTEWGPWALLGSWRTVDGFWDTDEARPLADGTRKVGTHEELDLQGSYSGFKGWELSLGLKNALDRQPPFSQQNASDNTYTQMGFAELYSSRGRFYYMSATYSFR